MELFTQITGFVMVLTGLLYAFLMIMFSLGWNRLKHGSGPIPGMALQPVSVIVAARNEEKHIEALLNDLSLQDYPAALLEVIIVDDRSADRTAGVVQDFIRDHQFTRFRLIRTAGPAGPGSKKEALTQGIAAASGSLILTTDADCRVPEGWVSSMAGTFSDENIMMTAGPVCLEEPFSVSGRFQALEFLGLVASGAGAIGAGHPFICNGASLAYRKAAFTKVAGYSDNMQFISGDDVFLLHKIRRAYGSRSIAFARTRKALVRTEPEPNLPAFLGQRIRWASKSRGYRDALAIVTALTVFLTGGIMAALFIGGFLNPLVFAVFVIAVLLKSLIDLPLLIGITKFTGNEALLKWLLPFQAVYPFYIVAAGLMSLLGKSGWK